MVSLVVIGFTEKCLGKKVLKNISQKNLKTKIVLLTFR